MLKNTLISVFCLLTFACASNTGGSAEPAPTGEPPAPAGFAFDHVLGKPVGCVNAVSTDTSKVILRGSTCTDDGAECFDVGNNRVEVWATPAGQEGSPYGAASYVEVNACDEAG